jgi:hypothetical protein
LGVAEREFSHPCALLPTNFVRLGARLCRSDKSVYKVATRSAAIYKFRAASTPLPLAGIICYLLTVTNAVRVWIMVCSLLDLSGICSACTSEPCLFFPMPAVRDTPKEKVVVVSLPDSNSNNRRKASSDNGRQHRYVRSNRRVIILAVRTAAVSTKSNEQITRRVVASCASCEHVS